MEERLTGRTISWRVGRDVHVGALYGLKILAARRTRSQRPGARLGPIAVGRLSLSLGASDFLVFGRQGRGGRARCAC